MPWLNAPDYKPRTTWTLPNDALPPVSQDDLPPLPKAEVPPQYQEAPELSGNAPANLLSEGRYQTQSDSAAPKPTTSAQPAWMAQPAAPAPLSRQPKHDEVSALAKQDALNKKLFPETEPAPKKEKDYNAFYKELEQKTDKRPVSEAVMVPDDMYFSDSVSNSGPATNWLKISSFTNRETANDYADRMFRYDENLSGLDITISGNEPKLSLLVGPLSGVDANSI